MPIHNEYIWSDSRIALGYIKNSEARYHMFVANRVQEIRPSSDPAQWYHVPGKMNPVELLSRGSTLDGLQRSIWWNGPDFLHQVSIEEFLNSQADCAEEIKDDLEKKKPKITFTTIAAPTDNLSSLMEKYGSWTKLVRAIANAKKMLKTSSWRKWELTPLETLEAEQIVIKLCQADAWNEELRQLAKSNTVSKQSTILELNPFIDKDGLLRVGGKAKRSLALSDQEKHPLIIPKGSHIAKLIILHHHQKVHHQGHSTTLGAIRGFGYWIIGANKIIKNAINKCVQCKAMRGLPMEQLMGDLPKSKVEPSPPFTHVGGRLFWPLYDQRQTLRAKTLGPTHNLYEFKSRSHRTLGIYDHRCIYKCPSLFHLSKRSGEDDILWQRKKFCWGIQRASYRVQQDGSTRGKELSDCA